MKNQSTTIKLLFPSVIYEDFNETLVNSDLVKLSKNICLKHGKNSFITNCLTTIESKDYGNVLELEEFSEIKSYIIQNICNYINFMKFKTDIDYKFTSSWLNYYCPGDYQELHIHNNNMLSDVFYLIANNEKDFYFRSQLFHQQPILLYNQENNGYNQYNETIETFKGKLLLFMNKYLHGTLPSKKERMSISFNVTF